MKWIRNGPELVSSQDLFENCISYHYYNFIEFSMNYFSKFYLLDPFKMVHHIVMSYLICYRVIFKYFVLLDVLTTSSWF